jgi:hypothetical protein
MRKATLVYVPAVGPSCVIGELTVHSDDSLEWRIRNDLVIPSEDDAEVIAGLGDYLKENAAYVGGIATLEMLASTFSHTLRLEESVPQLRSRAAGQALLEY